MEAVSGRERSRSTSWSGQRLFASVVEPRPSVSESPTMTAAAVVSGDQTSTPLRKYQWAVEAAPGRSSSRTWSPASRYEVVREPGCEVTLSDACPCAR